MFCTQGWRLDGSAVHGWSLIVVNPGPVDVRSLPRSGGRLPETYAPTFQKLKRASGRSMSSEYLVVRLIHLDAIWNTSDSAGVLQRIFLMITSDVVMTATELVLEFSAPCSTCSDSPAAVGAVYGSLKSSE